MATMSQAKSIIRTELFTLELTRPTCPLQKAQLLSSTGPNNSFPYPICIFVFFLTKSQLQDSSFDLLFDDPNSQCSWFDITKYPMCFECIFFPVSKLLKVLKKDLKKYFLKGSYLFGGFKLKERAMIPWVHRTSLLQLSIHSQASFISACCVTTQNFLKSIPVITLSICKYFRTCI